MDLTKGTLNRIYRQFQINLKKQWMQLIRKVRKNCISTPLQHI